MKKSIATLGVFIIINIFVFAFYGVVFHVMSWGLQEDFPIKFWVAFSTFYSVPLGAIASFFYFFEH